MAVSKAQQKAVQKYVSSNYDDIKVRVPKGEREKIKAAAEVAGMSVNEYIIDAIRIKMNEDSGDD